MQIDLSFVFKSALGKPKLEPEYEDNRVPKLDENGNPKMKEVTLWDVLEFNLESYQGGDGTKIKAIANSMVKAYENSSKVIEINADTFIFIKEKIIPQSKLSDFFKEQVKDYLSEEEEKHKRQEVGADFDRCVSDIKEKLGGNAVPIQLPIGAEDVFEGIIDLVEMKEYVWPLDTAATMDWMEQEQERGITITSAATTCFWKKT